MLPQSGTPFGRYVVGRRLGQGGMGVVFAATHRDLGREVALKLLAPDLSDEDAYRNRFLREARALAVLDSPYVVRVYDAGEQDGWLFIATELVPDGDLNGLVAQGGLPLATAAELVGQVARGVQVAHEAGILHRDIKPSNVLIRRLPDGQLRAVVCDFGIATVADADHTVTAGVIGTPSYMAPERHNGADASVATDIYSLGCLLWALVTGKAPYQGTASQVIIGHLNGVVPQLPGATPAEHAMNTVLRRAMAKAPGQRLATAAELGSALETIGPVVGDETVAETLIVPPPLPPPPPPPPPPPLPLTVSTPARVPIEPRRTGTVVAALVAAVLLVAGGAGMTALLLRGGSHGDARAATGTHAVSSAATGHQSRSTVARPIRCWDGHAAAAGRCTWPDGVLGLRWVFPSIDGSCSIQHNAAIAHSEEAWCGTRLHYSGWTTQAAMLAHYRREFMPGFLPSPGPGLRARRLASPDAAYKVVVFYAEGRAPWDVTLYAHDQAEYRQLMKQVRLRPAGALTQQ